MFTFQLVTGRVSRHRSHQDRASIDFRFTRALGTTTKQQQFHGIFDFGAKSDQHNVGQNHHRNRSESWQKELKPLNNLNDKIDEIIKRSEEW